MGDVSKQECNLPFDGAAYPEREHVIPAVQCLCLMLESGRHPGLRDASVGSAQNGSCAGASSYIRLPIAWRSPVSVSNLRFTSKNV